MSLNNNTLTTEERVVETLACAREDFLSFLKLAFNTIYPEEDLQEEEFMSVIAYRLERMGRDKENRLIFNLPPRCLKTFMITICYTCWCLGRNPSERIIIASYGDDLSQKFLRDIKQIMNAIWYKIAFPETLIHSRKNTASEFETTRKGYVFVTSTGATLTGRGANLIIVDDPIKADDVFSESQRKKVNTWFQNTLYTRLDHKEKSKLIVVMQRLHEGDLTAHLDQIGGFRKIVLPAIACVEERHKIGAKLYYKRKPGDILNPHYETMSGLEKVKQTLTKQMFAAQYQQDPFQMDGEIFLRKYFKYYEKLPAGVEVIKFFMSCDPAHTMNDGSNFTVLTLWALGSDKNIYLLDLIRKKMEFPELVKFIKSFHYRNPNYALIIEDAGVGSALLQTLRCENIKCWYEKPSIDKVTRANRQSIYFEQGRIWFPKNASWLADLEKELLAFPYGKYDDQVDSLTQALLFCETRVRRNFF